jgi:hypothetical protein
MLQIKCTGFTDLCMPIDRSPPPPPAAPLNIELVASFRVEMTLQAYTLKRQVES